MPKVEARESIRIAARAYEEALPSVQRKELGQFFTGIPLGKLLAHLAIAPDTATVLDPMAGHGDLLDAVFEAAGERGISLERLDAVEIDPATADTCSDRLARICAGQETIEPGVITGDAFDPATYQELARGAYDLVIANPPYVRYQTLNGRGENTRSGLTAIIESNPCSEDRAVWSSLAAGYSGLADLSVPAWILAGLLVRPGGRLALVVPATWRSRDYSDVIRYMLLRCFRLEAVVEDTQPGWFSDALVRTHLIVARRLSPEEVSVPLGRRSSWPNAWWVQVAPAAADPPSLVGAAWNEACPEAAFAAWLRGDSAELKPGLQRRSFSLAEEWSALRARAQKRTWFHRLESGHADLPLFRAEGKPPVWLPETVSRILPGTLQPQALSTLEDAGISVGQGLRTGCNRFFYVTDTGAASDATVQVITSSAFGVRVLSIPAGALRPVLSVVRKNGTAGAVIEGRLWLIGVDVKRLGADGPSGVFG